MRVNKKQIISKEKQLIDKIIDFVVNNKIKVNSPNYEIFKKMIKDLFYLDIQLYEIEEYSEELTFEFVSDQNIDFLGKCFYDAYLEQNGYFNRKKARIVLNENTESFKGLSDNNMFFRKYFCVKILKSLFHEIAHYRQIVLFISNQSSERGLKYAKEYILLETSPNNYAYKNNHDMFSIESDAQINAITRFSYFLENKNEEASIKLDYIYEYLMAKINVKNSNGLLVQRSREDYVNEYTNYLITKKKKSYLLMKYPILQKEYNLDCTRKSLKEFIDKYYYELNLIENDRTKEQYEKQTLINNTKKMYFDIIGRTIYLQKDINLEELDIEDEKLYSLLNELIINNERLLKQNLNILKEKYNIKLKNNSKLNYVNKNTKTVQIKENNDTIVINVNDYIKKLDISFLSDKQKNFVENIFFKRLPKSGIFILKNNQKITIKEFYENYILKNINIFQNYSLIDYLDYLEKIVLSENETEYLLEEERIKEIINYRNNKINNLLSKNNTKVKGDLI